MSGEKDVGSTMSTQKIWWEDGPTGVSFEKAVDLRSDGKIIGQPYYTGWYREFEVVDGKRLLVEYNFNTGERGARCKVAPIEHDPA